VSPRLDKFNCTPLSAFRVGLILFTFLLITLSTSPAFSDEKKSLLSSLDFFNFYQEYISPVDGDRCAMYPSCSRYASLSIKKHGFIPGWIMGLDRLVRCGRDEVDQSHPVWTGGQKLVWDPVEANDFWWSEK
jgi:putative component of membrane protein insertase Oxa1/YidC/SpoIIIJ protein YidD